MIVCLISSDKVENQSWSAKKSNYGNKWLIRRNVKNRWAAQWWPRLTRENPDPATVSLSITWDAKIKLIFLRTEQPPRLTLFLLNFLPPRCLFSLETRLKIVFFHGRFRASKCVSWQSSTKYINTVLLQCTVYSSICICSVGRYTW